MKGESNRFHDLDIKVYGESFVPEVFHFIPQQLSPMIARLFLCVSTTDKSEEDVKRDALDRLLRTTQQRHNDTLSFL